jgi:hypothetical protein
VGKHAPRFNSFLINMLLKKVQFYFFLDLSITMIEPCNDKSSIYNILGSMFMGDAKEITYRSILDVMVYVLTPTHYCK